MRQLLTVWALTAAFCLAAAAGEWTGVIMDEKCSGNPAMKSNADCAAMCIKGGSPAVLVTDDGKVYRISNQKKVVEYAGHKVTLSGKMQKESIEVDSVKM